MLFVRFSFLILLIYGQNSFAQTYSEKECLDTKFEQEMVKQEMYFGLIEKTIAYQKDGCVITIKDKKFLEREWKIDVCREPIHIKLFEHGDHSVYKRKKLCEKGDQTKFCQVWADLKEEVLDYSLIYAAGEREKLTTDHGKVFCSYELIKNYLLAGKVYSKYGEPEVISEEESSEESYSSNKTELNLPSSVESPKEAPVGMKAQESNSDQLNAPSEDLKF